MGGGGDGVDGVSVDGMSSSGSGVVRLHPPFLRPSARRSWDSRLALPVPLLMTVSPSSWTQRSSAARISGSCSSAAFSACCDAADGVADGGVVLLARKSETRSRPLYPQNAKPEEHFNVLFCTYIIK